MKILTKPFSTVKYYSLTNIVWYIEMETYIYIVESRSWGSEQWGLLKLCTQYSSTSFRNWERISIWILMKLWRVVMQLLLQQDKKEKKGEVLLYYIRVVGLWEIGFTLDFPIGLKRLYQFVWFLPRIIITIPYQGVE